jgi:hypothetical protein
MPRNSNKNNGKNGNGKHSDKILTHNEQRRINYRQMGRQGMLGKMELTKYDERRTLVQGYFPGEHFPCQDRGETPNRDDFRRVSSLYRKIVNNQIR